MIKNFNLSLLLIIFINYFGYSSLEIIPEFPKVNETITLKYMNINKFNEYRDIIAEVYIIDNQYDVIDVYEIILKKSTNFNIFKNNFTIPSNSVFALIKIRGIFRERVYYDNNSGELWDIIIYEDNQKPSRNSNYLSAMSRLTKISPNLSRLTDYQKVINNLEQEIKFYPDNFIALLAYNSLLFELRRINQNVYNQRVTDIIKKFKEPSNDIELNAIITSLRTLKRNSEADELISEYIRKHPKSKFAEEFAFNNLSKIKRMDEFNKSALNFVINFPESVYRNRVFSALVSSYLQQSMVLELIQALDTLKNVPPIIYSELAINLVKNKNIKYKTYEERINLSSKIVNDKIINIINDESRFDKIFNKPNFYSEYQWKYEKNNIKSELNEVIGDYYLILNDTLKAIDYFIKSINLLDNNIPIDLLEKTIELLVNKREYQKAFEISIKAINTNSFNDIILNYFKLSYLKSNRDTSIFEAELSSILESVRNDKMVSLYYEKMNKPMPYAYFKTLDGLVQDFEQTKDKISVIYFWSTWCEPCVDLVKVYSEVFNFYLDSNNVFIYSILTWERNKSDLKNVYEFIQRQKPEFPVFIDEDDIIPYRIGITGLPTFVFVDKDGFIRFIQTGFSTIENLVQNIKDKIYYLSNMNKIEEDIAKELKMMKKY